MSYQHRAIQAPYALIGKNRADLATECGPGRELNGLIEKFWFSDKDSPNKGTFEILPDGNFDLVFVLNDSGCTLFFAGPYTRPAAVPILPGKEYFGVRFRPGRMPRLADIRPAELVDTTIAVPQILGINTDTLGECLLKARGIDAKRTFIEQVLRQVEIESLVRQDLCGRCAQIIDSCNGRIKVHELARCVGTSIRTIERAFVSNLGIPPKMFIRLVRFGSAVQKLRNGGYSTLAHIAYDCGYADQSHFIKDFQNLARRLPSAA